LVTHGEDVARRIAIGCHIDLVTLLTWLPWLEFNEGNIRRYPPKGPGVYALSDASKNLIYYGSSGNLEQRLLEQLTNPVNSCVRSRAKYFKYLKTNTEDEARELEKKLIDAERPPCNMQT